jgi:hypothetical protein
VVHGPPSSSFTIRVPPSKYKRRNLSLDRDDKTLRSSASASIIWRSRRIAISSSFSQKIWIHRIRTPRKTLWHSVQTWNPCPRERLSIIRPKDRIPWV